MKLNSGDMMSTKCQKCKRKYFIYVVNSADYYTFMDYYLFHRSVLSKIEE